MEQERLLNVAEVAERYGVHWKTLDKYLKRQDFPKPVALFGNKRNRRWREADVNNHIRALFPEKKQ